MARTPLNRELHTSDIKMEQHADVKLDGFDAANRTGEILHAAEMPEKEQAANLAFMEEPVTIRIERGQDKHSASAIPIWNNGIPCEVLVNGKWIKTAGYIPVETTLTTKRKYVEQLLRAKVDTVETVVKEEPGEDPQNLFRRYTSALATFSIIKDANPRGVEWAQEVRSRNY